MKNRREESRHNVLTYLAERPALAFPASALMRSVNRQGGDFTLVEIQEAAELLVGLGLSTVTVDALGSTRYYQASAEGVLHHERQP